MDKTMHGAMMAPIRALAMSAQRDGYENTGGALFGVWNILMSPDAMTMTAGSLSDEIGNALNSMAAVLEDVEPDGFNMRAEEYLEDLQFVLDLMSEYPDDGVIPHPPTYPFHK